MKRRHWLNLAAVAMIACAATVHAAETAMVKGNPDSKIYHKASCRFYNAKSSTKEFKSEADAVKAGYQACKQCAVPNKEQKPEKQQGATDGKK